MIDVTHHFMKLGLSENEAKAYVATIALGEGKVKEISQESGVPRSKTYEIMEQLAEKGLVEVENSTPIRYRANEPMEASNHLMKDIKLANDEVMKYLIDIGRRTEKRENPIWTSKGDWATDHKMREMIESAKSDVVIICINRHLIRYAKQISMASETKPITIVLVHQPESFVGLLGKAKILKLKLDEPWQEKLVPELGAISEKGLMIKDSQYNLELLMTCDHHDSMLLSKEGESYRAIMCSGTVLNFVIQKLIEDLVKRAEVVKKDTNSRKLSTNVEHEFTGWT